MANCYLVSPLWVTGYLLDLSFFLASSLKHAFVDVLSRALLFYIFFHRSIKAFNFYLGHWFLLLSTANNMSGYLGGCESPCWSFHPCGYRTAPADSFAPPLFLSTEDTKPVNLWSWMRFANPPKQTLLERWITVKAWCSLYSKTGLDLRWDLILS